MTIKEKSHFRTFLIDGMLGHLFRPIVKMAFGDKACFSIQCRMKVPLWDDILATRGTPWPQNKNPACKRKLL